MKQLLLLPLIAFLSISATYAPQAENDATWEETIEFLQKYKEELHSIVGSNDGFRPYLRSWDEVEVTNEYIRFTGHYTKSNDEGKVPGLGFGCWESSETTRTVTIYFANLSTETIEESTSFPVLYFIDHRSIKIEHVTNYKGFNESCNWYRDEMRDMRNIRETFYYSRKIIISSASENDEMKLRFAKAFSHLAKLATEKRDADRKASGDKF